MYRLTKRIAFLVVAFSCFTSMTLAQQQPSRAIYDKDPNQLWNRVYSALFIRTGPDGKEYGHDRLEPLLWRDSEHLLSGPSAEQAQAVLEEFLREKGESSINDPLKQAMLQRDLWLVASWISSQPNKDSGQLLELLAKAIHRLALTSDKIAGLPDNYAMATASGRFPDAFDPGKPDHAYLPRDLFKPDSPWICVGRTDTHTAPLHLQVVNPFTNSTFLVFLKLPSGRDASQNYLQKLTSQKKPIFLQETDKTGRSSARPNPDIPQLPAGTELALVRRAMLIDRSGRIVASPITEGVQLRVYRTIPTKLPEASNDNRFSPADLAVFDIQLRRSDLFANEGGGLREVSAERDFKTGFASHAWDEFTRPYTAAEFPLRAQPFLSNRQSCVTCHSSATVYATMSFQRYWSRDEKLDDKSPTLYPIASMRIADVEKAAIRWKESQPAWIALKKFLAK